MLSLKFTLSILEMNGKFPILLAVKILKKVRATLILIFITKISQIHIQTLASAPTAIF